MTRVHFSTNWSFIKTSLQLFLTTDITLPNEIDDNLSFLINPRTNIPVVMTSIQLQYVGYN